MIPERLVEVVVREVVVDRQHGGGRDVAQWAIGQLLGYVPDPDAEHPDELVAIFALARLAGWLAGRQRRRKPRFGR